MHTIPATTHSTVTIFAAAENDGLSEGQRLSAAEEAAQEEGALAPAGITLRRGAALRLCAHIKFDGVRCGSPALRRGDFCYFHNRWRLHHPGVAMPFLDNPHAIQFAIMDILRALSQQELKQADAGTMLYGLQLAIQNLRAVQAGPSGEMVTEDPALHQFEHWLKTDDDARDSDRICQELKKRAAGYTSGRTVEG